VLKPSANTGTVGEMLVRKYYRAHGHSVLEQGSRSGKLELDLYTKDGSGVFHLVEVKTSRTKVCGCEHICFTISEKVRSRVFGWSSFGWNVRSKAGDSAAVSPIDWRFDRDKLFHMKQLASGKEGSSSGTSCFQIDFARVELCFLHKVGIITLFENIEL